MSQWVCLVYAFLHISRWWAWRLFAFKHWILARQTISGGRTWNETGFGHTTVVPDWWPRGHANTHTHILDIQAHVSLTLWSHILWKAYVNLWAMHVPTTILRPSDCQTARWRQQRTSLLLEGRPTAYCYQQAMACYVNSCNHQVCDWWPVMSTVAVSRYVIAAPNPLWMHATACLKTYRLRCLQHGDIDHFFP